MRQQVFGFAKKGKKRGPKPAPPGKRRVRHRARRFEGGRFPLHVTLKTDSSLPNLRRRHVWKAVQWALLITVARPDFRICQISIQGNHIHLIVEADSQEALSKGMQGFKISLAKQINARLRRKGRVFADRYHARALTNPTVVRNALKYVLGNWRHHGYDRQIRRAVDPFSSAYTFGGWKERDHWLVIPLDRELLPVAFARTWLLAEGWMRAGGLLSVHDVPGELPPEARY